MPYGYTRMDAHYEVRGGFVNFNFFVVGLTGGGGVEDISIDEVVTVTCSIAGDSVTQVCVLINHVNTSNFGDTFILSTERGHY